ncbi:uncharacterized protein METZ01_LOCUS130047, partial [marine metagenome]
MGKDELVRGRLTHIDLYLNVARQLGLEL